MACEFEVPFQGSAAELNARARKALEERRGTLDGDAESGEFKVPTPVGPIQGNYAVTGQKIRFTVRRRPMMISCGMIESRLRGMLGASDT